MNRWQALFDEYRASEAERLEHDRRAREADAARRDYEAWARAAVESVLGEISAAVEQRNRELALHAGLRLQVKPPRMAPARQPRGEITFVELRHGEDVVYVYAYHELGHAPLVHYMIPSHEGFLERTKHARLISLPGARLVRGPHGSVLLERILLDGSTPAPVDVSVDDIVFRAFELLLRGRAAHRSAKVKLPEPDVGTAAYGSPPARA